MNFLRSAAVDDDFDSHNLQVGPIKTAATHSWNIVAIGCLWFAGEREVDELVLSKIRVECYVEQPGPALV